MVMALLVLIGFGALYVFVFDPELQGSGESIESVIASQEKEIHTFSDAVDRAQVRLDEKPRLDAVSAELSDVTRENVIRQGTIDGLAVVIERVSGEIEALGDELEEYKDQYRKFVRGKAVGEIVAELVTASGAVYKDIEIREVSAVGIQIRHEYGNKRIPYEELPAAMQDRFQFDAEQKSAAMQREREARIAHERAVSAANEAREETVAGDRTTQGERAKDEAKRKLKLRRAQASALFEDIRDMRRQIREADGRAISGRGSGKVYVDKSKALRRKLEAMELRLQKMRSEIAVMEANL